MPRVAKFIVKEREFHGTLPGAGWGAGRQRKVWGPWKTLARLDSLEEARTWLRENYRRTGLYERAVLHRGRVVG